MPSVSTIVTLTRLEVTRLSRSGRLIWVRCAYASALLLALFVCWADMPMAEGLIPVSDYPRLANNWATGYFVILSLTIHVVTPLYFGGIVVDERRQHMPELLLTTDLSAVEILLSKYLARVSQLVSVFATGLPVMVIILLLGGLDIRLVVLAHLGAVVSILSVAALTTYASVLAETNLGAALLGVALTVVVWAGLMCVLVAGAVSCYCIPWLALAVEPVTIWWPDGNFNVWSGIVTLLVYACVHGVFAWRALSAAARYYREFALTVPVFVKLASFAGLNQLASSRGLPSTQRDHEQLLWQALDPQTLPTAGAAANSWVIVLASGISVTSMVSLLTYEAVKAASKRWSDVGEGPLIHAISVMLHIITTMWVVWAGLKLAASVPSERERNTLDMLLMLPMERRDILRSRMRVAWRWAWAVPAFVLPTGLVMGVFTGPLTLLTPLALLTCAADAAVTLAMALWCATACQTTLRARLVFVTLLTCYHVLPWALLSVMGRVPEVIRLATIPAWRAWNMVPDVLSVEAFGMSWLAVCGLLVPVFLAWLLWCDALRRFEREGK